MQRSTRGEDRARGRERAKRTRKDKREGGKEGEEGGIYRAGWVAAQLSESLQLHAKVIAHGDRRFLSSHLTQRNPSPAGLFNLFVLFLASATIRRGSAAKNSATAARRGFFVPVEKLRHRRRASRFPRG